jgi:hypothetical protein
VELSPRSIFSTWKLGLSNPEPGSGSHSAFTLHVCIRGCLFSDRCRWMLSGLPFEFAFSLASHLQEKDV